MPPSITALFLEADDDEDAVRKAVSLGGDADALARLDDRPRCGPRVPPGVRPYAEGRSWVATASATRFASRAQSFTPMPW